MATYNTMPSPSSYGTHCFYRLPHLVLPTESLTEGTCLPQPPPSPPKTERPRRSLRTNTNPLAQHPTTPSDLLPSPLSMSSMPGSFPITPSVSPRPQPPRRSTVPTLDYLSGAPYPTASPPSLLSPTNTSPPSSLTANHPKRPLSIRNVFSLRNLKRSYNNRSTDSVNTFSSASRPCTPGTPPSTAGERPTLKKKTSMAFWGRRKSSLSLGVWGDEDMMPVEDGKMKIDKEDTENVRPDEEKRSSPPPMLPELEGMARVGDGSFMGGGDVFGF